MPPSPLPLIWRPQPKQHALIACPIEDVLFGGARGGGKTDGLLGDWMGHANAYGQYARGLFLRKSYPELEEVEARCRELFPYVGAQWQATKRTWAWPTGATLRLRYLEREQDTDHFQGHQYSWVGADEVGNYPSPLALDKIRACLRSPHGVPCFFRGSANPGGVGHNWLKARYIDPAPPMHPFATTETIAGETITVKRCYIPATLDDNPMLVTNDPQYWQRVVAAAGGNEALVKAWRLGLWDVIAGGYFDDLWDAKVHIVEPFDIPKTWRVRRAFDWGSSKPFSVGWWAHSDGGTSAPDGRKYPKGTRFRIMELYGWDGKKPNEGLRLTNTEIARRIKAVEDDSPYKGRVQPGPADSQIFDVVNGSSIADDMQRIGIRWQTAQKGPGSRRQGWQLIRQLLKASTTWPMEEPGIFVFSTCRQFIRTFPVLPRDPTNADDVDSSSEDHCFAGETLVETPAGVYPIADLVGKQGMVCTDRGPQYFSHCRLIQKQAPVVLVTFSNGRRVSCTPEHLFLTIDKRWVKAQDLADETCYNSILSQKENMLWKWLSSARLFKSLMVNGFISAARTSSIKEDAYIKKCGNIITGRFLMDLRSTINTMIALAIKLKTLNCCGGASIGNCMPSTGTWESRENNIFFKPKKQRQSGMRHQKVSNGIKSNMQNTVVTRLLVLKRWYVRSVEMLLKGTGKETKTLSAPISANQPGAAPVALMTKHANVSSAQNLLSSTNIQNKRPVVSPAYGLDVVSVQPAGRTDVYCLTVPQGHRFAIEGGIIVHNCGDETRYECSMPFSESRIMELDF